MPESMHSLHPTARIKRARLRVLKLLCMGALVCQGGIAMATPGLEGENLIQPRPAGFKVVDEQHEGNDSLTAMVPADESAQQWTRMVTTQVYRGMKDAGFFDKYKAQMDKRWTDACDTSHTKPFSDGKDHGYPTHVWMQICAFKDPARKPQVTLFKFIQGDDAAYVVQMAFHDTPAKGDMALALVYLDHVTVCDTRKADAPCPTTAAPQPSASAFNGS